MFPAEVFTRALQSWEWIGIGTREPLFTSLFGDVFFRAPDGIWLLDILEGTLTRPWDSAEELKAVVDTPDGADRYLLAGLAMAAYQAGIVLGHDDVFGFRVSPVLGGEFEVANLEAASFEVMLDFLGQIHEQLHDLPPGTKISGLIVEP